MINEMTETTVMIETIEDFNAAIDSVEATDMDMAVEIVMGAVSAPSVLC
jgi:hypothetical protein